MRRIFVQTENVARVLGAFDDLMRRGAEEACFMLIYGPPGVGKSRIAAWLNADYGWPLARAKRAWGEASKTPGSATGWMLRDLLGALGGQPSPRLGLETVFAEIIRLIEVRKAQAANADDPFAVVVDEVDHIAGQERMMETLRDIVDYTQVPFVLIGMDRIHKSLCRMPQIMRRIGCVEELKPATLQDARDLISAICERPVADDLIAYLHKKSRGMTSEILQGVASIERCAGRRDGGAPATLADMAGQELLIDRQTGKPIVVEAAP